MNTDRSPLPLREKAWYAFYEIAVTNPPPLNFPRCRSGRASVFICVHPWFHTAVSFFEFVRHCGANIELISPYTVA